MPHYTVTKYPKEPPVFPDVIAETVQIGLEVGLQNLAIVSGGINQLIKRPGRGVVEDVTGASLRPSGSRSVEPASSR